MLLVSADPACPVPCEVTVIEVPHPAHQRVGGHKKRAKLSWVLSQWEDLGRAHVTAGK